jgi:hypothetical protein
MNAWLGLFLAGNTKNETKIPYLWYTMPRLRAGQPAGRHNPPYSTRHLTVFCVPVAMRAVKSPAEGAEDKKRKEQLQWQQSFL